ncbi:hypothetical protein ACIQNV_38655 [Streptomyces hydrogenans]|uniref:hypothetical protein n=1 Tax=Streptomyces hydrogenans TaxID=1873719 RepID=UPI0034476297
MDFLGFYAFMILFIAIGAALLTDFRGFRRAFVHKPGETDEYAKRFMPFALAVGVMFVLLPLAAVAHSFIR